jgi:uncharacterized SAM-binding protein YcdF (DUF218 family)
MKLLFFILSTIIFGIYSFFNLGYFLDVTEEPSQADLIVCLGGGDHPKRVEKTIELYKKNYLKADTIIFTGVKQVKSIEGKFDDKINIIINPSLTNTVEEVKYIKEYMIKHSLSTVLIVTEPPHSRRISLFAKIFKVENDGNLSIKIVSNDYKIWNSKYYYKNDSTKQYAFSEVIKTIYNLFVYGLLENLGLKKDFDNYFYEDVKENKGNIFKLLSNL